MYCPKENYLAHYGILGMRWGKRSGYSGIGGFRKAANEARAVGKSAKKDFITKYKEEAKTSGKSSKLGSFRNMANAAEKVRRDAVKEHMSNIRKATSPEEHKAAIKGYVDSIVKDASNRSLNDAWNRGKAQGEKQIADRKKDLNDAWNRGKAQGEKQIADRKKDLNDAWNRGKALSKR